MREILKTTICVAVLCLAGFTGNPEPADAYVLEGRHILHLMLADMKLPGSFQVRQQVIQYDPDTGDEMSAVVETARFRMPGEFRSEVASDAFFRIYVASGPRSIVVTDNRITGESNLWTDYYKDIFWHRSLESLETFLESRGVDASVSSLGRFQGLTALVIGDAYPSESAPQLWVARDPFRPLRWIYQAADSGSSRAALEFRYMEWKQFGNVWFPARIEFFQDNRMIRRILVESLVSGPPPVSDMFDVDHIRRSYATEDISDETIAPESEIRRRIDDFKRIYE